MKSLLTFLVFLGANFNLIAQPVIAVKDTLLFQGYVGRYWEFRKEHGIITGDLVFNADKLEQILNATSYEEMLSISGVYMYLEIIDVEYYKKILWNLRNPSLQDKRYLFSKPRENDTLGVHAVKIPELSPSSIVSYLPNEENSEKLKLNRIDRNYILVKPVQFKGFLIEVYDFRVTDLFFHGSLEREYAEKANQLKVIIPMFE